MNAMETERFGDAPWSVEYRPERTPYPWCLIDNGEDRMRFNVRASSLVKIDWEDNTQLPTALREVLTEALQGGALEDGYVYIEIRDRIDGDDSE